MHTAHSQLCSPKAHRAQDQPGSATPATDRRKDRNCKAHELDNLYVVDASFFCSSGAVNPGLTIIANALRVGDHLLERMGSERADEKMTAAIA